LRKSAVCSPGPRSRMPFAGRLVRC